MLDRNIYLQSRPQQIFIVKQYTIWLNKPWLQSILDGTINNIAELRGQIHTPTNLIRTIAIISCGIRFDFTHAIHFWVNYFRQLQEIGRFHLIVECLCILWTLFSTRLVEFSVNRYKYISRFDSFWHFIFEFRKWFNRNIRISCIQHPWWQYSLNIMIAFNDYSVDCANYLWPLSILKRIRALT